MHFQKKWNLIMCPNEPVLSIWSGKKSNFGVVEKFRNKDLKPPAPMCRSQNYTQKKKKLLAKRSSYEEDIAVWKSLLLLFFLKHGRAPKNKKALDFVSDVQFGWNKIWFGGFFDLLNVMQIYDLRQQAPIVTYKISLLQAWWPIFLKKQCKFEKKFKEVDEKKM